MENLKDTLNEDKHKEELELLNKIEKVDVNKNFEESLSNLLSKEAEEKEISNWIGKTQLELKAMKERLLSKDKDGFDSIEGKDKSQSFTEGETNNLSAGEETKGAYKDLVAGGAGESFSDNSNGAGGSSKTGNIDAPISKEGELYKKENSTKLDIDKTNRLDLEGAATKKGEINKGQSKNIIGIEGTSEIYSSYYKEFEKSGIKYIDKYEVSHKNKKVVIKYYEKLMEESQ